MQRMADQAHRLLFLCLFFFSHTAFSGNWFGSINVGDGVSRIGKTNTLTLFTSSMPGITDRYVSDSDNSVTGLMGIGGGYRFSPIQRTQLALGVSASYLAYSNIDGVVHPLVNVAPDFDTLNYHYITESYLFMVEPSLVLLCQSSWHPFVTLGLGVALNQLSRYSESIPPGSTAGPALLPFRDHTTTAFAYVPSIGIEYAVNDRNIVQVGYEYIHAGRATLGRSADQETNQRIQSELNTHLIAIHLLFA